jgi:heme/copper-type cytochrome/quinol oxidase subunit 4
MIAACRSPAVRAWFALVVLTVAGFAAAEKAPSARFATTLVVLIAGVKIHLIGSNFMELRWDPRPWRLLFECWILVAVCIVLGGYWACAIR